MAPDEGLGITWNKEKWQVAIKRNGLRYYIGRFATKREAIKARNEFLKLHGNREYD